MIHGELDAPDVAVDSQTGREILRVWLIADNLHCSVRPNAWSDVAAWGIALADIARHIADAAHMVSGADRDVTVASLAQMFLAELGSPTDVPTGRFVRPPNSRHREDG
jgi:hypothetical protein